MHHWPSFSLYNGPSQADFHCAVMTEGTGIRSLKRPTQTVSVMPHVSGGRVIMSLFRAYDMGISHNQCRTDT